MITMEDNSFLDDVPFDPLCDEPNMQPIFLRKMKKYYQLLIKENFMGVLSPICRE